MRDLNKDFGAAVSEARRKLGLTQVSLAEELGKTDRSISDMENGKTTPKLDTVALFARRLGIIKFLNKTLACRYFLRWC